MPKKNYKNTLLWLCVGILFCIAILEFVIVNKLESKNLKDEISKVEIKLTDEQSKLQNQINTLVDSLKEIITNFNTVVVTQTKSDSTLSKQIEAFQTNLTALEIEFQKIKSINQEAAANKEGAYFSFKKLGLFTMLFIFILLLFILLPYLFICRLIRKLPEIKNQKDIKKIGIDKIIGRLKEYIISVILNSQRINDKFFQISPNEKDTLSISSLLNSFEIRIKNLENLIKEAPKNQLIQSTQPVARETTEPLEPVSKYLKGKSGKVFSRVENTSDNSFFKISNSSGDTAQFEFCGDESEAIAKRIFSEDICKIVSGSYQNAISVKTFKPGKIKRVGEQWEVTEQVEINLI